MNDSPSCPICTMTDVLEADDGYECAGKIGGRSILITADKVKKA